MTTDKQAIASQLAQIHGLRVFPVAHGSHIPAIKFSKKSSTDLDLIKKWWKTNMREIGIHTGDGVFVLDVDLQNDGPHTLQNLIQEYGALPNTLTVKTPSGGAHYYFKSKKNIRNSASKVGDGLDIRGHNGYVVGPGSERMPSDTKPGGEYLLQTEIDQPIADAPDWLEKLALIQSNGDASQSNAPEIYYNETPVKGTRNTTLFKEACMLRGKGWTHPVILNALRMRNNKFKPPLNDKEVRKIVDQAAKYAPNAEVPKQIEVNLPGVKPFITQLSEYESLQMFYLWGNYFPRAAVSVVAGNPGQKKTALMLTVAAAITRGADLFPGSGKLDKGSVMLATSEDSIEHTIRTRVDAAGGDLEKFYVLPSDINFEHQYDLLDAAIQQIGDVRLIILDPITAFMKTGADSNSNTDVRTIMKTMHILATDHNIAIVGISHLNKDTSKSVWARLLGSVAWNAAARAVYMIGQNPDDPIQSIVACAKTNFVAPPMLQFETTTTVVETTTGNKDEMKLDVAPYNGELSIDEVFEAKKHTRADFMLSWLRRRLSGGKMVLAKTLELECKTRGYSWPQMQKVSAANGIEKHKASGEHGTMSYWCLPGAMLPGPSEMSVEDFMQSMPKKTRRTNVKPSPKPKPGKNRKPGPDTADTDR